MSDAPQQRLAGWSIEDHLAFEIGFALPRAPIKGFRRALTERERHTAAKAVVEHLKLCGWNFELPSTLVGHGTGRGG